VDPNAAAVFAVASAVVEVLVHGHDDWIRRTPDRLYLECLECGLETQGWLTKNEPVDRAGGAFAGAPVLKHTGDSALAMVRSPVSPSPRSDCSITHHDGEMTVAA
jgi:hypothetical protein